MPVFDIDLKNVNADNLRMTNHQIRAVMLYPENAVKRRRFVLLRQGEELVKTRWGNPDDTYRQELECLSQIVPDLRHEKGREFAKRFQHGLLVGGILAMIKQLHDHGYEGSKGKAIHIFERCRESNRIIHEDFLMKERAIRSVWQRFKPVAHFWAMFYLAKGKVVPGWRAIDTSPEALFEFLARAERFRHFGENHDPGYPENVRTVLEAGKTWTVTEDFTLPDLQIHLPPPSSWVLKALDTYNEALKERK